MAKKQLIIEFEEFDLNTIVADIEGIRKLIPQRYEMEHLTAVVYDDPDKNICVGYKDLAEDEFWVRGHMPGMPLMPGVIMCEAAAQLCSFHAQRHNLLGADMVGFGGIDDVRFRGAVRPGDRLVISAGMIKVRKGALIRCAFQAFVEQSLVCSGVITGIPLPVSELKALENAS